jgi:hypothetical protein
MKKTYLAKRNALIVLADQSWGARALLVSVCVVILRLAAPNAFMYVTAPLFIVSESLAGVSHTLFSSFEDSAKLAARNTELTNELTALQAEKMGLSRELAGLSGLLGQSQNQLSPSKGILAEVLARPPVSPYDVFVVLAGTRAGVSQGMLALGAGGVPVGVVQETTEDYARVVLFTAAGVETAGWVGDTNTPINLSGAGGGVFLATVARDANLVVGEAAHIAGPQLAPIGTIARIDSDPASPSVTLQIVPALNMFGTKYVRLISGGSISSLFSSASSTRIHYIFALAALGIISAWWSRY